MSDILATLLTIVTVLVFLTTSEVLAKFDRISKENARKVIHISVGHVIFFIPMFETKLLAAAIPFTFVFGNFLLSPLSPIERLRLKTFKAGHAWGTILYPLSLSIITFVFFDRPWLIVASFLPVVYGDGFAAVFGPRAESGHFNIGSSSKTLIGTSVVSIFSWFSVGIGMVIFGYSYPLAILTATVVSILAPLIELISPKGTDNIVLPISLMGFFAGFSNELEMAALQVDADLYMIGITGGVLFGFGGYLAKVLTADGAIAGFLITTMMLGLGGYSVGVQLLLFFVLGSGATKVVKKIAGKTQDEFEKGGERRDAIQAVAKAGIPAVLSLFFAISGEIMYFYAISGIMAAALVDTLSTEIGIATRGIPFKVLAPWRRAKPGDTGVISFSGTLGGMGFGLIMAVVVLLIVGVDTRISMDIGPVAYVTYVVLAGTLGMLTDSVLGASIQRQFKCVICEKVLEAETHHDKPTEYYGGLRWFNNDVTNVLGSGSGALWIWLLVTLLG